MAPDWFAFQTYRTLHGSPAPIDLIRRNGWLTPVFRHEWDAVLDQLAPAPLPIRVVRPLLHGLTACERRTWRRLLDGWSIDAIALADGTSRAAIYFRIRGTGRRGGMVRKNAFVARWWETRRAHLP